MLILNVGFGVTGFGETAANGVGFDVLRKTQCDRVAAFEINAIDFAFAEFETTAFDKGNHTGGNQQP